MEFKRRRNVASKRRLDAALEIVAGFLILLGINWQWFSHDMGWVNTLIHPYFVIVLLIAARYGTFDGIAAGAAGCMLLVAFKAQADPESFSSLGALLDLELMLVPYLLLLVGTVLGEIRQVAEDEVEELWRRIKSMRADLGNLSGETRLVRRYNEDLQERIASSTETTAAFYEAAANVQSLSESESLPAILEVVHRFVGAEKCAIYFKRDGAFELRSERGWSSPDEFARSVAATNPMLARVLDGEVVTLLDVPDAGGSDMVMVAPLFGENADGTREVHAAVAVQSMPLSNLTAATVRNFAGISDWGSRVLGSSERYERVRERDPADEITGTYRYSYLSRRLDEEVTRWQRYKTPSTLLLLRIDNYERVPPRKRAVFLRRVGREILGGIRSVDLVARWKSPDTFALLLPSTDAAGAKILASRIDATLRNRVLSDVPRSAGLAVRFGVSTTGVNGDGTDELIRAAERLEVNP